MKILVTGGRNYTGDVSKHLFKFHCTEIITGGASGADTSARKYAENNHIRYRDFPADWANEGRSAGPIRNQRMLVEGQPDLVVVFPGGKGTADMKRRAIAAGIPIYEVFDDSQIGPQSPINGRW